MKRPVRALLAGLTSVGLLLAPAAGHAAEPKLLFGLGPTASGAERSQLAREAPVGMLTSWYNGPKDLGWMRWWEDDVQRWYEQGKALHVVVYSNDAERYVGAGCGRAYPVSDQFRRDMVQLARLFAGDAGDPPLYLTLFSEFQTYACTDNAYLPEKAYYQALKRNYLAAVDIFHREAPNSRVSLGWGGWQTRWDDPARGEGRSMIPYFADVMRRSDFQSFQAMMSGSGQNPDDIRAMTEALNDYPGGVMLAHYKPDNGSSTTFDSDMRTVLSEGFLTDVVGRGLFAMSFMDQANLTGDRYGFVRDRVRAHGR